VTPGSIRRRVAAAAAAALVLAAPAATLGTPAGHPPGARAASTATLVVDKGIIRRVTWHLLVLRTLDGAVVRLRMNAQTRVVLNGHRSRIGRLGPGLVASARHTPGGLVRLVQAVGTTPSPLVPAVPVSELRGVIDAADAAGLTLRLGDGGTVAVSVAATTRILLRGRPGALADLEPGLSAIVRRRGERPAIAVRAWGQVPTVVDTGVLVSVAPTSLVLRRDDGGQVQVALVASTRVRVRGAPATVADLRVGQHAAVTHTAAGRATLVRVPGG
jgi:hypothetical protein